MKYLKYLIFITLILHPLIKGQINDKYIFKSSLILDTSKILTYDTNVTKLNFVDDSIKRMEYKLDSIARIKRIKDSISITKKQLKFILECYFKAIHENIPISGVYIQTYDDTLISKAGYFLITFNLNQPFKPWYYELDLLLQNLKIVFDNNHLIRKITSKNINIDIEYQKNIIIIKNIHSILNNKYGSYYKIPIDSIFLDNNNNIIKIKEYLKFYNLINNKEKGDFLFENIVFVKQFYYNRDNSLSKIQIVNFGDRWYKFETQKVTGIINYEITKNNMTYIINRKTDPENIYADGKYIYEFDSNMNLIKVNYINNSTAENWRKEIELNNNGHIHCYYDYIKDKLKQSLCFIYNYSENKYQSITTIFEDDGISYFQRNNTTGQTRRRNKLTLEWGPWE